MYNNSHLPNGTTLSPLRIGIAGPVGSGKTALVESICRQLAPSMSLAVITNDIFTKEDALFLQRRQVLEAGRIRGVETGGCPHSAIRDDVSMNLEAVLELEQAYPDLSLILVESGGDNLAAAFSPELVDLWIYIIDVSAGDKIPRKGGPGITRSDLLVVNKIDLAPLVGASLEVMDHDARRMRGDQPIVFTNLKSGQGLPEIIAWISAGLAATAESERARYRSDLEARSDRHLPDREHRHADHLH